MNLSSARLKQDQRLEEDVLTGIVEPFEADKVDLTAPLLPTLSSSIEISGAVLPDPLDVEIVLRDSVHIG